MDTPAGERDGDLRLHRRRRRQRQHLHLQASRAGRLDGETQCGHPGHLRRQVQLLGDAAVDADAGVHRFDYCYGVAVDGSDNVYVSGAFLRRFRRPGQQRRTAARRRTSSWPSSIPRARSNGRVFHGDRGQRRRLRVLPSIRSGNAYISGNTNAALDGFTPAGSHDLVLLKYNTSGTRQWTRHAGDNVGGVRALRCRRYERHDLPDGTHRRATSTVRPITAATTASS